MSLKKWLMTLLLTGFTSSQLIALDTSNSTSSQSQEGIGGFESNALVEHQIFENFITQLPSAWKGHRPFAQWLVHHLKPNQIVDLGVDYGYSTFIFANAARKNQRGIMTGIDFFQGDGMTGVRNTYEVVLEMSEKLNFHNLEIIKGDFNEVSKTWDRAIDILHIDGYHSYEAVSSDFKAWSPFVSDEGIILFHDIYVFNPTFEVINFFRELEGYHKLYFLQSYGLGVITKNTELYEEIKKQFSDVYDYSEVPL